MFTNNRSQNNKQEESLSPLEKEILSYLEKGYDPYMARMFAARKIGNLERQNAVPNQETYPEASPKLRR